MRLGQGGTDHRPVAAGDPPAASGAPKARELVRVIVVPKIGGRLPPRTARLAVPLGFSCITLVELFRSAPVLGRRKPPTPSHVAAAEDGRTPRAFGLFALAPLGRFAL